MLHNSMGKASCTCIVKVYSQSRWSITKALDPSIDIGLLSLQEALDLLKPTHYNQSRPEFFYRLCQEICPLNEIGQ